ncbi:pyridine nucleotide-disulfide oxidoreductase [Amylibacter kogurei]|uniref:Pyridine nucleotide-disulfide oxidoreductase n=1 Tax=Paramylibacter kogurei TaxID=1889778 RepID=A0A2G5K0D6_9RHOB|nr:FAD/NAD(P)-binding oxidoreductase [Amylibacter kogurei]PIB22885.1 pyridine nucleotide-disulfide oxidoreductase [Amylibacter kogurei]
MAHVVVIGAGQAGSSVVAKLRNDGFEGEVTLIGAEPILPYQRPPLSKKYLLGEMDLERLFLRPKAFYDDNNITLKLGKAVDSVDSIGKTIAIGGEKIGYDQLVFATGSSPRYLPASVGGDLGGVYAVRDLADVDAMASEFESDRHVLVIGGGYIGLEAAAVAASKGLRVSVVEMADRILQRVACKETSDFFRRLHQENGVEIIEGVGLETLIGDGRVRQAKLSDGRILNVDFVVAGIGIMPCALVAEMAGVAMDNGIATDKFGRTNVDGIWAAGDCASFPYNGQRIRLESVPNAIDQAETVAQNIMGGEKEYNAKPWFWSDQYDVKLQIAGLNSGYDDVIARRGEGAVSFWYFKGDAMLAVDAMNDPRGYMIGKRIIEAGKTIDKTAVADPATDLRAFM